MREVTANIIGKKPDTYRSDQKLRRKNNVIVEARKDKVFREQLGFFEHDDSSTSSYSK